MSAYLVARVKIHNPEVYAQYVARSKAIVESFGGEFLVRGGASQRLEGPGFDGRIVLVKFPSVEAAKAFHASPEYQVARAIREPASDADFMLVEGVA
jgi:uncharacterized protein (DUF1330 family)